MVSGMLYVGQTVRYSKILLPIGRLIAKSAYSVI